MAQSDDDRLRALEARIAAAKSRSEPQRSAVEDHHSQAQLAWRMVIELVAGMGIGFGIGYGLDWVFGTSPWLMIVFLLLGFIAGIKTMMRSAQEIQAQAVARDAVDGAQSTGDGPGADRTGTRDGD